MPLTIATWNINSVRLRLPIVEHLLDVYSPDILCLQETKCPDELFPHAAFEARGYNHIAVNGQKGYHGVATISRRPIETVEKRVLCGIPDSRHLSTRFTAGEMNILVHNFYVPAGGDEPDPEINPKFRHKLDFVAEMTVAPRRMGSSGCLDPGRRSQHRAARARCLVAQAASQRGQPHARRDDQLRGDAHAMANGST